MSNIQTGAERMPHDLSHLGFLAGQIGRLITISTTPVIAGDSFEMDAVGALRLSPLRRGLAIDSTVDIFTFYVPHRHVYGDINIIARRTGKDVNSHTVLDGIITTIMATIQRINIIGSREGSRNRRRLKANQTGKKFRVGIKSNISTNRNNLISGVDRCIHLNAMKKTTITSINRQTIKI